MPALRPEPVAFHARCRRCSGVPVTFAVAVAVDVDVDVDDEFAAVAVALETFVPGIGGVDADSCVVVGVVPLAALDLLLLGEDAPDKARPKVAVVEVCYSLTTETITKHETI